MTVLTALAVVAVSVVTATPLKLNPPFPLNFKGIACKNLMHGLTLFDLVVLTKPGIKDFMKLVMQAQQFQGSPCPHHDKETHLPQT